MQHLYTLASTQHNSSRDLYLGPVAPSSLVLRGVWVVTYTSLSLDSSSSSLLTTQLSAWSWRNLLPFLLGLLLSKESHIVSHLHLTHLPQCLSRPSPTLTSPETNCHHSSCTLRRSCADSEANHLPSQKKAQSLVQWQRF